MEAKVRIKKLTEISAYQLYQVLRMLSVILISIILVKAGLDKEEVSSFEFFVFLANLFSFFWVMGIKNAALSYFPKLKLSSQKIFFFNLFLALQMAGLLFCAIIFFISDKDIINVALFRNIGVRFILAAYLFLYAPTILIEVIFILRKRAGALIRFGMFIHIIQILFISLTAWFSDELIHLFLVLLFWMAIKWIYTILIVLKESEFKISVNLIRMFLLFSLPLIMHILMGNGMEYVDGILVNRYFDPDLFAVFRYGARELPIVLVLLGALSSGLIPLSVKDINASAGELKTRTRKLMHLFYPTAILLLFISPFLYRFFYSEQYMESAHLFNIYLLIIASRIILVEVFFYATHKNKILMFVSFGELMLNLVLSILLLQLLGLAGIAFATVIAFMSSKVFLAWYTKKYIAIPLRSYLDIPLYLSYSAALYLCFGLSYFLL